MTEQESAEYWKLPAEKLAKETEKLTEEIAELEARLESFEDEEGARDQGHERETRQMAKPDRPSRWRKLRMALEAKGVAKRMVGDPVKGPTVIANHFKNGTIAWRYASEAKSGTIRRRLGRSERWHCRLRDRGTEQ